MDTVVLIIGIVLFIISKILSYIPFLPPPFSLALVLANMILPAISYVFLAWGLLRLVMSLSKFTQIEKEEE
jgi:hypothetical protein